MYVFVCDFRKGNILSQMQWMGLALRKGTTNISCIAFPEGHGFNFLSFSLKTGIFEGCNKDVKLASRELNDYCFQLFYGTRECENIPSVRSRSDFIMHNYYVKKLEAIFTVCIKIRRKN
jgi:hypothetical protein